jgi:hypothetical protein
MSKQTFQNSLPKILPGTVHEQRVRCGRANCRCARGQLHTAHYRFWRDRKGRQHKAYVKTSDVESVRAACAAWAEMDAMMRQIKQSEEGKRVMKEFRRSLRRAGLPPELIRQFR